MLQNTEYFSWEFKEPNCKKCITLSDYTGDSAIVLSCTQLSEIDYPKQSQRNKIVNEWIDFLNNNPKALTKVYCHTRMNQKLFNAICSQTNLAELYIKWGVYPDISKIESLKKLKYLYLNSGASLQDIAPLKSLKQLEVLLLGTVGAVDYMPLKELTNIMQLGFHSGMDNFITVNSLEFISSLKVLKNFRTTGFRLKNGDYSPILTLKNLEYLFVNMPAYDHKIWNSIFQENFKDIKMNRHLLQV